jgi:hypothetical protein
MTATFAAFISAGTALLVVVFQSVFKKLSDSGDKKKQLLIEAYTDYLRGLSEWATRDGRSENMGPGKALILTGKQKITAYAPSQVVRKLAALERTSRDMTKPDAQGAMVDLVLSMRRSVGVSWRGLDADIHVVLVGARTE